MANNHLGHIDLKKEDILDKKTKTVNEENLDILCRQINEQASYDKVGSSFYKIDKTMAFSGKDRSYYFVNDWLDHLATLSVTAKNVGYLG